MVVSSSLIPVTSLGLNRLARFAALVMVSILLSKRNLLSHPAGCRYLVNIYAGHKLEIKVINKLIREPVS